MQVRPRKAPKRYTTAAEFHVIASISRAETHFLGAAFLVARCDRSMIHRDGADRGMFARQPQLEDRLLPEL
jgi:hypothetical protein